MARAQYPRERGPDGEFRRQVSAFRDWVDTPGIESPGPYVAEAGRYHLYVSLACPWAHRVIIARELLGLQSTLTMSVVDPIRDERGWAFREGPGHSEDPVNGFSFLSEAYLATAPDFEGRVTVPTLWDRESRRVVNNESSEILRMLDGAFRPLAEAGAVELYPERLRSEIDAVNEEVYGAINNGVYRAGFATTQEAYDKSIGPLFEGLGRMDQRLASRRYLTGEQLTEADIRLYTTLIRFDAVYVGHFKCNRRRIVDYEHLAGYLRDLYQIPAFGGTTDFDHIKRHYYVTHRAINPTGIVPAGPEQDLQTPHGREGVGG